jgi:hypothetical protein
MSCYIRLVRFSFLILIAPFATLEGMKIKSVTPMHHQMIMVSSAAPADGGLAGSSCRHPEQGYDLEYIWKQVDRGAAKDAASYYIQASESGGEPPGHRIAQHHRQPRANASDGSRAPVALARLGPQYHDEAATALRRAITNPRTSTHNRQ